jgi:hypothetical protein
MILARVSPAAQDGAYAVDRGEQQVSHRILL